MKKYGSLDGYLLNVRTKWLGERAMWLRSRIQDELSVKEAQANAKIEGNDAIQHVQSETTNELKSQTSPKVRVQKGRGIVSELDLVSERLAKMYSKSVSPQLKIEFLTRVVTDRRNRNSRLPLH